MNVAFIDVIIIALSYQKKRKQKYICYSKNIFSI